MKITEIVEKYDNKFDRRWDILTDDFLEMLKQSGIVLIKDVCTEDVGLFGAIEDLYMVTPENYEEPIYLNRSGFVCKSLFDCTTGSFKETPQEWRDSALKLNTGFLLDSDSPWTRIHINGETNFGLIYLKDLPEAPEGFETVQDNIEKYEAYKKRSK